MADQNTSTMLSSWYDSYQKDAAANSKGTTTPAPATPAATTGYTAKEAAASTWAPDANSTVQGQLKNVLDSGSPLLDRAETKAKQGMNQRGLLNSTMAITAGQSALYDAAMPIAQQDANTFADAGKTNSQLNTQVSVANAGASNDAAKFGADARNQASMQAAGFNQQTGLQREDLAAQARSQDKDLASRYDLAQLDVQSRAALQAADLANQQKMQAAQAELQKGLQATDLAVKQSMQQFDASVQQAMQGTDTATKLQIATLQADSQKALAEIEARYKNELQGNASMAQSYQSMVDSFTRVMLDPNLDASAKTAAIGNLTTLYNNTLKMQADVSDLQLGQLLAPSDFGAMSDGASSSGSPSSGGSNSVSTSPGYGNPLDQTGLYDGTGGL